MDQVIHFPKAANKDKPTSTLKKAKRYPIKCKHGQFVVDTSLATVECGKCGEKLNPVWVLAQFADKDSEVRRQFAINEALVAKTQAKTKCKCEHCGQMTKIANRQEVNEVWNQRNKYD